MAKDFRKMAKEKGLAGEGNPTRPKGLNNKYLLQNRSSQVYLIHGQL